MSAVVNTVLGPIPSSQLGTTLYHEHLKIAWLGWEMDPYSGYDRKDAIRRSIQDMQELKELGVSTVIDPLPMGLGRDPEFHAEVSSRSGINLIISTGLDAETRSMPPYFKVRSATEIAAVYVHDLTKGLPDSGVKAGIIKAATGEGTVTENETRAFRAAAKAALTTGAPVVTHTTHGTMGVEQAQIMMREGLSPRKIVIGHCCFSKDLTYLRRIMDTGCSIGFDQIGSIEADSDEARLERLMKLLELGYADRILLSQDSYCCIVGAPYERIKARMDRVWANRHSYLIREFLPMMRRAGVGDKTISQMLAENPRKLFEAPAKAS
ncbi:MAG: phosphotriesterase-related protein [Chloroflexi bacterium]|nr:phosphotriesterase-related protein [Chloroflexota bacterium]